MKRLAMFSLLVAFVGCKKSDDKAEVPTTTLPETAEVQPDPKDDPETKPEEVDLGDYKLVAPDDLAYAPADPSQPDGMHIAVVDGNPMEGPAVFFLKIPAKGNPGLHSHTAGYHALVVSGEHKHWLAGEKEAKVKGIKTGGYWNQPGGQAHGDMCVGPEECVLFVIMDGKMDFTPATDVKKAKPNKAYKVVHAADAKWGPMDPSNEAGPKIAMLDGDMKTGPVAFVLEVPAGGSSGLHGHTSDYHALVVSGAPSHWVDGGEGEEDALAAGTYWKQPGKQVHGDSCSDEGPCRLFVMMPGAFDFVPNADEKMPEADGDTPKADDKKME